MRVTFAAPGIWMLALVTTVVFVVLKLTERIDWDWIWVLSPVLGFVALFALLFIALAATLPVAAGQLRKRTR